MDKVAFITLGCKLNFAETSSISKLFVEKGFKKADFEDTPNVFVINTCSVTDRADKKCAKIVRNALKISPSAFIIVTGCFAQLKPKEIVNIPGVDAVVGSKEKFKIFDIIHNFQKGNHTKIYVSNINSTNKFESAFSLDDKTRTFLKIQDGCNYYCSFCTIPFARGRSRSDTIENIIKNVRNIAQKGIKEIVLTGVNIGDYGIINSKRKTNFLNLVKKLDNISEDIRFRISSIEPNLLEDEIIEIVANSKVFVPHFHIPLQSGNNEVLKNMRRKYKRELYSEKVHKIKSLMPKACIGVDVIVGFPSESKDDFLDTYQFLNEIDCSYLHVFPYSERPNTRATNMDSTVPIKERMHRSKMLRILSEKKKRAFYEQNLEQSQTAIFEHKNINGKMLGFTENYVRVISTYNEALINKFVTVKTTDIDSQGLMNIVI